MAVAIASMGYLLFQFGHTELTSHERVLATATVTAVSALVAGFIAWLGEPEDPSKPKQPLPRYLRRD